MIELDAGYLAPDAESEEILGWQRAVDDAHSKLMDGSGPGADFRGWIDPGALATEELIGQTNQVADDLRSRSDALVVIGIGGSYLGARAVIEALAKPDAPEVCYAGNSLSADYHSRLLARLADKPTAVNVISKSGTTTEPAIAFRLFRKLVEEQVGAERASEMIVATTDGTRGALKKMAQTASYRQFVVPDDVGGRFSVLSPVGLLPIAYAGIDIRALVRGARDMKKACDSTRLKSNPCYYYAAARNALYDKGYCIEMLAAFEPRLRYFAEWWKQLFGESEGKQNKGLFPASLDLTADLHSMGQYAQQGRRMLIETFLIVDEDNRDLSVPGFASDDDGLGYLEGKAVSDVNQAAYRATALAHREGGVPNMTFRLKRLDEHTLGGLIYLFERACAVSGYLLRVNPFNQPGVEAYKKHMFAMLGKPGFEAETAKLPPAAKESDRIKFKSQE